MIRIDIPENAPAETALRMKSILKELTSKETRISTHCYSPFLDYKDNFRKVTMSRLIDKS